MQNGHSEPKDEQQRKIKQLVEEATVKGRELLTEGLENAKELLEEKAADLKKKAAEYGLDEAADSVRNYVRRNPWKSVGIAVAVGFVVGRLFSSDHD